MVSVMALVFFVLQLLLCSCCRALSWSRKTSVTATDISDDVLSVSAQDYGKDAGLTEDDVQALLLSHDTLDKYSRRSDCFRRGAGVIRSRCGQLDMNEDERVKAAISMTLCELATARHHSPPLECASFSLDSTDFDAPAHSHLQGDCVDALSRSAQFWSSYSGYLREVPQLCFAFRRWNDIDTAKDIYKNATLEKIALIRFLLVREKSAATNMHAWENHLTEMRALLMDMQAASGGIKVASSDMVSRLESSFDDTLEVFRSALTEFQRRSEGVHLRSMTQFNSTLDHISKQHAFALASLLRTVESSLIVHVNAVFALTRTQNQESLSLANQLHNQWIDLGHDFSTMQQSIVQISDTASQAMLALETSTQSAHFLHQTQLEASFSASHLVDTITQLTATTHSELEKINGSAFLLRQSFLRDAQGYGACWKSGLLKALEVVLRVDPASLQYLNHFPVFRVFLGFLSVIFYIFRTTFSTLMSAFVVLVSSRKYIAKLMLSSSDSFLPEIQSQIPQHSAAASPSHLSPYPTYILPHRHRYPSDPRIRDRYIHSLRISRIPDRLCNPNLVSS